MTTLTVYRERSPIVRASAARAPAHMLRRRVRMEMSPTAARTVPLAADGARAARCRVELCDTGGWNVRLEVDDRVITTTHCADWHRAERACAAMASEWDAHHTAPSARR